MLGHFGEFLFHGRGVEHLNRDTQCPEPCGVGVVAEPLLHISAGQGDPCGAGLRVCVQLARNVHGGFGAGIEGGVLE